MLDPIKPAQPVTSHVRGFAASALRSAAYWVCSDEVMHHSTSEYLEKNFHPRPGGRSIQPDVRRNGESDSGRAITNAVNNRLRPPAKAGCIPAGRYRRILLNDELSTLCHNRRQIL